MVLVEVVGRGCGQPGTGRRDVENFLGARVDVGRVQFPDLDGRDNWMRGEFDSKWCYPEKAIATMMKTLEKDPTLHIEIVSCEPGMQYLEAHIYDNGMWNSF